jgi:hypothetical protein
VSQGEDREAILARRRFLTVALATAGLVAASCDETSSPQVCLAVPMDGQPGPDTGPKVCLEPSPPPRPPPSVAVDAGAPPADAEVDAGPSADGKSSSDAGTGPPNPRPRVCLNYARPKPPPRVCLSPVRKPDDPFE